MRKNKEKDAEYMRDYRKSKKDEINSSKKDLFKYCFSWIRTEDYDEDDWNRELDYLDKLVNKALERKDSIINSIKKYAHVEISDITREDIYELIKNDHLLLSSSGGLKIINIQDYKR